VGGLNETVEFKAGNKAYLTYMGTTYDGTYSVDGDKVAIDSGGPFGKFVATLGTDGTLTGVPPGNTTLKKAP